MLIKLETYDGYSKQIEQKEDGELLDIFAQLSNGDTWMLFDDAIHAKTNIKRVQIVQVEDLEQPDEPQVEEN